ncbi:MAG: hypothetical protein F6K31_22240 [Symploca sp. SIO2G7]|nr:hypothetical protein [Symploca sp. SIO2G7]
MQQAPNVSKLIIPTVFYPEMENQEFFFRLQQELFRTEMTQKWLNGTFPIDSLLDLFDEQDIDPMEVPCYWNV